MRYSPSSLAALTVGAAICATAAAGDPEKLTRACPRLAPINGAPAGMTVIDNDTVLQLAKKGRFAAIAVRQPALPDKKPQAPSNESSRKKRWRAEYRRSAEAIHKTEQQLTKARGEFEALESRYFSLRKAIQRIRLQPRLDAKKEQIVHLTKDLRHARNTFSRVIRQARLDGAQPGWFRGLHRP